MARSPRPAPDRLAPPAPDDVVLLDETGAPIGQANRYEVHTTTTPLHLAFSTYVFNARGEVLITRRALSKKTWPGVWTNSCCGHPRPGETLEDAARRRISEELGLQVGPLTPLLPDFRYRAVDASGIVENEICPVYAAFVSDADPHPDPAEVAEWAWVGWRQLTAAITATPHVYSPWAALQVPRIASAHPTAVWSDPPSAVDVDRVVADVDQALATEMETLAQEWRDHDGGLGLDVLERDLPHWLRDLVIGQGKRLRVRMAAWGYVAAGGSTASASYQHLVRVAAALETLHLFALVHDDVMDESESRRGHPSAHVEAARWHRESEAYGDTDLFGRNIAILLGDLAHMAADRLVDGLPQTLRDVWYTLSLELIAGQRADLSGAAAGRRDRSHAEHVAQTKSGRYTIVRPLQLGALAAGASAEVVQALMLYGDHLGRAFALRDDLLGVWGDPEVTGKPAGDDLFEAKATVLLYLAGELLTGSDRDLLARVGTPEFSRDDVPQLADAMRAAGVDVRIEQLISASVAEALACLEAQPLSAAGAAGLRTSAHAIAWRTS